MTSGQLTGDDRDDLKLVTARFGWPVVVAPHCEWWSPVP
jgi:hypothetical protein